MKELEDRINGLSHEVDDLRDELKSLHRVLRSLIEAGHSLVDGKTPTASAHLQRAEERLCS